MEIYIMDDGAAVYVNSTCSGADDCIVQRVTGNVSTADGALRAAVRCLTPTLGQTGHNGMIARQMSDGVLCLAAGAYFMNNGGLLKVHWMISLAQELTERAAAYEVWMGIPLADALLAFGLGVAAKGELRAMTKPDWLLLGHALVNTAMALDKQNLVLGVACGRILVLAPVGSARQ